MATLPVTCDTIGSLAQGEAGRMIDDALRDVYADIEERADSDEKPRKLTITLSFQHRKKTGVVETGCSVKSTLPPRESTCTLAALKRKDGRLQLLFNDGAPEDPGQMTIDQLSKAAGDHQGEEE